MSSRCSTERESLFSSAAVNRSTLPISRRYSRTGSSSEVASAITRLAASTSSSTTAAGAVSARTVTPFSWSRLTIDLSFSLRPSVSGITWSTSSTETVLFLLRRPLASSSSNPSSRVSIWLSPKTCVVICHLTPIYLRTFIFSISFEFFPLWNPIAD